MSGIIIVIQLKMLLASERGVLISRESSINLRVPSIPVARVTVFLCPKGNQTPPLSRQ